MTATYVFIDPEGNLTSPRTDVAAVSYAILTNPADLHLQLGLTPSDLEVETAVRANLTPLGISTDSSTSFSMTITLTGFEPMIFAFPLDAQGQEILGDGRTAFATTVNVPEPATMLLLGTGLAGIAIKARKKLNRRKRKKT